MHKSTMTQLNALSTILTVVESVVSGWFQPHLANALWLLEPANPLGPIIMKHSHNRYTRTHTYTHKLFSKNYREPRPVCNQSRSQWRLMWSEYVQHFYFISHCHKLSLSSRSTQFTEKMNVMPTEQESQKRTKVFSHSGTYV